MNTVIQLFSGEFSDLGMDQYDVTLIAEVFDVLSSDCAMDSSAEIQSALSLLTKARTTLAYIRTKYRRLKKRSERAKDLAWHSAGKIHGQRSADRNTDETYTTALALFHNTEAITRGLEDLWFTLLGKHTEVREASATYRKEMEIGL